MSNDAIEAQETSRIKQQIMRLSRTMIKQMIKKQKTSRNNETTKTQESIGDLNEQ